MLPSPCSAFSIDGQDLVSGEPSATVSQGLNRFIWDMRYPKVSSIPGLPPVVINPIAKPGKYQVRLTVDGESQTQLFELKINPSGWRNSVTAAKRVSHAWCKASGSRPRPTLTVSAVARK